MIIKNDNMSQKYDKNRFGERLTALRKRRWEQYKSNLSKKNNPYKKYACCKTQDSLAAELGIERRTFGKWELGTSYPSLDKAIELCNILGCEIDYLLGADDMEGFNHVKLASHYSGISEKIITHAIEDSNYQDCLNYFMHPDNCSKLVNHITLNAWKDFLTMHEFDSIADPLKSLIQDIFYQYQAFTSFSEYSLDSYKKFVVKSIPADSISFSPRKSDERINVNSCIPDTITKDLALSSKNKNSYDAFIEYIAKCSYETLNTKALLDVKKKEMSNMFIKLFEDYLSAEEYVSQYSKEMEMIE